MKLDNCVIGHFEADGNAVNLILGFIPEYLLLVNLNAVAGEIAKSEWFGSEMGDSKDVVTRRLTDNGVTGTDTVQYRSASGISQDYNSRTITTGSAVSIAGGKGVTIAAAFMDDSDEIFYLAIKGQRYRDHGDINA